MAPDVFRRSDCLSRGRRIPVDVRFQSWPTGNFGSIGSPALSSKTLCNFGTADSIAYPAWPTTGLMSLVRGTCRVTLLGLLIAAKWLVTLRPHATCRHAPGACRHPIGQRGGCAALTYNKPEGTPWPPCAPPASIRSNASIASIPGSGESSPSCSSPACSAWPTWRCGTWARWSARQRKPTSSMPAPLRCAMRYATGSGTCRACIPRWRRSSAT